ncbi:uncharacterized protein LOC113851071 [Abrus precatorius]|uniref:Uncharacterized protein LOC113851071 n=1 Tax=Abrus precatorius TaxID=3816 RepID=A0A8B8K0R9_ABRPR|nr:uncharacterized protein LOC113851071 [Abrus precatorius]
MEVYVDDIVVKSLTLKQHLDHLEEVFGEDRKHGMRFNPEKCTFGVAGGKFLGFMLFKRGIEANPDKCKAIIEMASPRNVKELQRLAGQIAALARFLPIMAERSRPFIELLKKSQKFAWSNECEVAFIQYKHMLAAPSVLTKLKPDQDMIVYLAVSDNAISSQNTLRSRIPVSINEESGACPNPYSSSVKTLLSKSSGTHTYRLSNRQNFEETRVGWSADIWNLHVDGSSNRLGSGAGVILEGPNAFAIEQSIRFGFKASNNQAEYEALLAGFRLAKEMGVKRITGWSDSKIVAKQVNDTYQVRDLVMLKYYQEFKKIKDEFDKVCVWHMPRNMNERADMPARLASQRKLGQLQSMVHQEILQPSITKQECMDIENSSHNWMTPIIRYLIDGSLPEDPTSAKKIKMHAAKYLLLSKDLYRRGISTPMLKCLDDDQASYVIKEIHEGICGTYSGGQIMAVKILRAGSY